MRFPGKTFPEPVVECFLEVVVHVSSVFGEQLVQIVLQDPPQHFSRLPYHIQEAKNEGTEAMFQSHTQQVT